MRRMISLLSLGCGMVLCASVYAGQIENPQYKDWAKYKPGTSTTMVTTADIAGQTSKTSVKTTLKEVADDKLTVETVMTMEAGGQAMPAMPPQTTEVKKMIDDPTAGMAAQQPPANMPKADVKTSEESVTVGAGTFKTKLTESTMDMSGSKTTSKTWMSDDVPGGVVKMESTMDGAMKGSTKMELTAFDKK